MIRHFGLRSVCGGHCGVLWLDFFVVPILNLLITLQKLLNLSILYYDEQLN